MPPTERWPFSCTMPRACAPFRNGSSSASFFSLKGTFIRLTDDKLDSAFLKGAEARQMVQLKGHRSVGGMRASLYNAMPVEGVQALVAYMKEFEADHG